MPTQKSSYFSFATVNPCPVAVFSQRIPVLALSHRIGPAFSAWPYPSLSGAPSTVSPAQAKVASPVLRTVTPEPRSRSQSAGAGGADQDFFATSQRAASTVR